MQMILRWLLNALGLMITASICSGLEIDTVGTAIIAAVVLGLINVFLMPIIKVVTLPINILTLGLFSLVINTLAFKLLDFFVPGVSTGGFWATLLAALVFSVITSVVSMLTKPK